MTVNTTDRPLDYNICTTQQPDVLGLFPGNDGRKTVVRWKAPAAGTYRVAGRFQNIDHATSDAAVVKNGDAANPLFAAFVEAPNACHQTVDTKPFSFTISVNAGDTLDFRLGWGRNSQYSFDGTGLAATIAAGTGGVPSGKYPAPFVTFALYYGNDGKTDATGVIIRDRVPEGFAFVPDAPRTVDTNLGPGNPLVPPYAFLNGKALTADNFHTEDDGRTLFFKPGTVKAGQTGLILYQLQVLPRASGGASPGAILTVGTRP